MLMKSNLLNLVPEHDCLSWYTEQHVIYSWTESAIWYYIWVIPNMCPCSLQMLSSLMEKTIPYQCLNRLQIVYAVHSFTRLHWTPVGFGVPLTSTTKIWAISSYLSGEAAITLGEERNTWGKDNVTDRCILSYNTEGLLDTNMQACQIDMSLC
jgi:hypothetical protein